MSFNRRPTILCLHRHLSLSTGETATQFWLTLSSRTPLRASKTTVPPSMSHLLQDLYLPGLLYRSSLPWNESESQAQSFMGGVSESAPSTSNTFNNVYAPQSISYSSYPSSAESQSPSSSRPWEMGAMAGSLDVTTGVYQRVPDHPRVRTAQACEKCRIRKAKCTGEKPCQRCRSRGLACEYAPERKMRGPNKLKRKSVAEAAASARRGSIVSTCSSSDDQSALQGSPRPNKRISTLSADTSSSRSHSPAHSSDGVSDSGSPHPRRARPPRLDLSKTNVYDVQSQLVQSALVKQEFDDQMEQCAATAARRNSLPPYLLQSYARVALTTRPPSAPSADVTPRASGHSEPFQRNLSQPLFGSRPLGPAYSHSRSSSGASVSSMPITPIHAMFPSDVMYSQDMQTPNSQLLSDLASTSPFGSFTST
ncbi:hypothetical protein QCA50_008711 [Cerrena zonata]|uniref:Zn(2)-C6 fungal-type domain-containing protein n=1 Tax=Cerrena zonata TaxID=2478898 RepID=A0AAW0GAI7_9APHY